ncbi:MAG: hypothetical protein AAGA48_26560 [Myxococcota bacterium]
MRALRMIPVGALSLTFVGCAGSVPGTWDFVSAERDGTDWTETYLQGIPTTCDGEATAGLTLFDWNAGFQWRQIGGCRSEGDAPSYARYVFVDRGLGGFTITPYGLDVYATPLECDRSGKDLRCIDPGNGRPITLRYRKREGA